MKEFLLIFRNDYSAMGYAFIEYFSNYDKYNSCNEVADVEFLLQ